MSKRNLDSPDNGGTEDDSPPTPPHSTTRFTIEQKVSGDRKGFRTIKSSVDPKDVVIQRRFGEGSRPLFSREDVSVNTISSKGESPCMQRQQKQRSSSNSSSEHTHQNVHTTNLERSHSPKTKKAPEKIPYFIDARREEDRLRSLYGHSHRSYRRRSRSRSRRKSRTRSKSRRRRRSRSRSRSRRRHRTHSRSRSRSRKRHRSYSRHRSSSRDRRRSRSRDRSRRRSPYHEQRYIPVAIPVEYPCPAGWIAPPLPPYPRNPFMIRPTLPPPIPYYPLRQPFVPMEYPRRPVRFPGRYIRSHRPGPK